MAVLRIDLPSRRDPGLDRTLHFASLGAPPHSLADASERPFAGRSLKLGIAPGYARLVEAASADGRRFVEGLTGSLGLSL
jgi:hypothetical protein